jgi:hypothetical protein
VSRKNSDGGARFCRARTGVRGARTLACRVHTRVNASTPFRICTRPRIFFHPRSQASLHRIVLDVRRNAVPLVLAPYPVIIGLALPKLPARAMQQPVCFTRRGAFQRFQQQAGRNRRQQKQVNVIRHDDEGPETIVAAALTAKQRLDHQRGNRFLPQKRRAYTGSIQVAIHPREGFAIGDLAGWRKMGVGKAAVQMPSKEEPLIIGIDVGKAALGHTLVSGAIVVKFSRSHECERGTQECVRHRGRP